MYDFLVGMGYRMEELDRKSYRQIDALYEVSLRRKYGAQAEMASLIRSAYHAEQKSFKKLINSMED